MAAEIITNVIAVAVAVLLIVSLRLAKKPKHLILGAVLIVYGVIKLLSYHEIINFNIPKIPIITYLLSIVVTVGGASLILDSFREKSFLRWISLALGFVAVVLSVIPTLYQINAITFEIPSYPEFINFYLYFSAGLLLIIAAFIAEDNASKLIPSELKLK